MNLNFLHNPWFWGIILGIYVLGYVYVKSVFKRVPLLSNKSLMIWVGILGLLFTTGFIGSFSTGSVVGTGAVGASIANLQVTTAFQLNGGTANIAENANTDDLINVRANDTSVTTGTASVSAGVITVTRTGDSKATSCEVKCLVPSNYQNETSRIGDSRNILNVNGRGEYGCFLQAGATSVAATTASPRMITSLPFAEGVNLGYVGVALDVDLLSLKYLTQYNSKTVTVSICGKPYNFEIDAMSAH